MANRWVPTDGSVAPVEGLANFSSGRTATPDSVFEPGSEPTPELCEVEGFSVVGRSLLIPVTEEGTTRRKLGIH